VTRTRREVADAEWRYTRDLAETVDCDDPPCGAMAGQTCRNEATGEDLYRLPAHSTRIRKAQETP
jgi:hypothetical protein